MKTIVIILASWIALNAIIAAFWVWWCMRPGRKSSYDKVVNAAREQAERDYQTFESAMNDPERFRDKVLKNRLN